VVTEVRRRADFRGLSNATLAKHPAFCQTPFEVTPNARPFIPSRLTDAFGKAGFGLATLACLAAPMAIASSHREAPFIAGQRKLTELISTCFAAMTNREAFVTILANFQPFKTHRRP
jgi:hypothetical protein